MVCWSYSWFYYLDRGLLSYYSRLVPFTIFGRLECDWVLFSSGLAVSPTKNLIIYSEILTKLTQSTPYFRTSRYLGLRHPPNSPNHHSQSVAGWSCFFWLAFRKTGSLTTTWCVETKKHQNSAFTLNLPVELAKCCLFWKGVKKFTNFLRFFFHWQNPTF